MPSAFDLLGTVFGVLSLLGCLKSVYRFLKDRQPVAQAELLEEALREARQRIDELAQYGYLSCSPALSAVYRSALAKIERESLRVRVRAEQHQPKSIVAALVYSWRHGVNCTLSRQIGAFTKLVRGIREQLDYPVESPFIDDSVTQDQPEPQPRQEPGPTPITDAGDNVDVQSAATGVHIHQNIDGMKHRNVHWASDPPADADITSQIRAIREVRVDRIQGELNKIGKCILWRTEALYGFPSNLVQLNQQLIVDQGVVPSEGPSAAATEPDSIATREPGNVARLIYKILRVLARPFSGPEEGHDAPVIEETPDEAAQREAVLRDMAMPNRMFKSLLMYEFSDNKVQGDHIAVKLKNGPWILPPPVPARTAQNTLAAGMSIGVSGTPSTHSY